jgi:hypothetical protein
MGDGRLGWEEDVDSKKPLKFGPEKSGYKTPEIRR